MGPIFSASYPTDPYSVGLWGAWGTCIWHNMSEKLFSLFGGDIARRQIPCLNNTPRGFRTFKCFPGSLCKVWGVESSGQFALYKRKSHLSFPQRIAAMENVSLFSLCQVHGRTCAPHVPKVFKPSQEIDDFNLNFAYRNGCKAMQVVQAPNEVVDTVRAFLNLLRTPAGLALRARRMRRRVHRDLLWMQACLLAKHAQRNARVAAVVDHWERVEARKRRELNWNQQQTDSATKHKRGRRLTQELRRTMYPRDWKEEVVKRIYAEKKAAFDVTFMAWFRRQRDLRRRLNEAGAHCAALRAQGHLEAHSLELQGARGAFMRALVAVLLEPTNGKPSFRFRPDCPSLNEILEFAEQMCSAELPVPAAKRSSEPVIEPAEDPIARTPPRSRSGGSALAPLHRSVDSIPSFSGIKPLSDSPAALRSVGPSSFRTSPAAPKQAHASFPVSAPQEPASVPSPRPFKRPTVFAPGSPSLAKQPGGPSFGDGAGSMPPPTSAQSPQFSRRRSVRFATTGRVSPDWGPIESSSPSKALGPRRRSSSILGGPMALARRRSVTSSLERQRSVAEPLPWLKSLEAVAAELTEPRSQVPWHAG